MNSCKQNATQEIKQFNKDLKQIYMSAGEAADKPGLLDTYREQIVRVIDNHVTAAEATLEIARDYESNLDKVLDDPKRILIFKEKEIGSKSPSTAAEVKQLQAKEAEDIVFALEKKHTQPYKNVSGPAARFLPKWVDHEKEGIFKKKTDKLFGNGSDKSKLVAQAEALMDPAQARLELKAARTVVAGADVGDEVVGGGGEPQYVFVYGDKHENRGVAVITEAKGGTNWGKKKLVVRFVTLGDSSADGTVTIDKDNIRGMALDDLSIKYPVAGAEKLLKYNPRDGEYDLYRTEDEKLTKGDGKQTFFKFKVLENKDRAKQYLKTRKLIDLALDEQRAGAEREEDAAAVVALANLNLPTYPTAGGAKRRRTNRHNDQRHRPQHHSKKRIHHKKRVTNRRHATKQRKKRRTRRA